MSTEPQTAERFNPAEHFRSLKGQQYLETKWRLVWFRGEHPGGQVVTEMLEHDAANGLAVFKAKVTYTDDISGGFTAIGTGHGSETRKDFADYLEKAETKAIGRALAVLGYGTQFAQELDEGLEKGGLSAAADSPVDAKPARTQTPPARRPAPGMHEPTSQQQPARAQTNDEAAAGALTNLQRQLHEKTQHDQEGRLLLLQYLKAQGKTRISEMDAGETTEWLLVLNDRETSPDAQAAPVVAAV